MPQISEFFGISIYMYYEDHNPPHFHAVYGEYTAMVDITDVVVFKGQLPLKQTKLVLAWCEIHCEELLHNWEILKNSGELLLIEPLR